MVGACIAVDAACGAVTSCSRRQGRWWPMMASACPIRAMLGRCLGGMIEP